MSSAGWPLTAIGLGVVDGDVGARLVPQFGAGGVDADEVEDGDVNEQGEEDEEAEPPLLLRARN